MTTSKPAVKASTTTSPTSSITKRWGFAVYRCDYSDESQWDSYMCYFKRAVKDELQDIGAPLSVWGRMDWTIIDDQKSLEGVSKEDVQKRFVALNEQSLSIEVPLHINGGWQFRHKYDSCICVDKWCLDTLDLYEAWLDRGAPGPFQPVLCAVINNACTLHKKERLVEQSPDSSKRPYTGWVYTHVACLSALCPGITQQYPMPPHSSPGKVHEPDQHSKTDFDWFEPI